MIRKIAFVLGALAILALLALCSWPSVTEKLWEHNVKPRQEALARELGLRILDYPYPLDFPGGYFDTVLKPGMTRAQVHRIVRGYNEVISCWGTDELYEYYGPDENLALRFAVVYRDDGKFQELRSDHPGDRTLGPDETCHYGLLGE